MRSITEALKSSRIRVPIPVHPIPVKKSKQDVKHDSPAKDTPSLKHDPPTGSAHSTGTTQSSTAVSPQHDSHRSTSTARLVSTSKVVSTYHSPVCTS